MERAPRLLPPANIDAHSGSPLAWRVLLALGVLDLVRGSIHLFARDGGAGKIAGINLSGGGDVIVMLFAVMGLNQILWGVLNLLVGLRYRAFVPLLLALQTAEQALAIWVIWLYKPLPVAAPGKYGVLVACPVLAVTLWASLRPRACEAASSTGHSVG